MHSHLNHSCSPNVSVRHLHPQSFLSKITVRTTRKIIEGEELCITYVDPGLGVKKRRERLFEWGFGTCRCERCCIEEHEDENRETTKDDENDEMIRQLKAGLGVT